METETKVKHTPGPWKVGKTFQGGGIPSNQKVIPIEWSSVPCGACGKGTGNWLIGWLFTQSLPLDQQRANARLIAASPELLEALKRMADHLAAYVENDIDCEDAIAALEDGRAAILKAEGRE